MAKNSRLAASESFTKNAGIIDSFVEYSYVGRSIVDCDDVFAIGLVVSAIWQ